MTVSELLHRISSREIAEWMAYFRLEPFGEGSEEFRMARIASILAETNRDEKKRRKPFTEKDFMRKEFLEDVEEVEEEEQYPDQDLLTKKILNAFGFSGFGEKKEKN